MVPITTTRRDNRAQEHTEAKEPAQKMLILLGETLPTDKNNHPMVHTHEQVMAGTGLHRQFLRSCRTKRFQKVGSIPQKKPSSLSTKRSKTPFVSSMGKLSPSTHVEISTKVTSI